jgi:hypothetical protein
MSSNPGYQLLRRCPTLSLTPHEPCCDNSFSNKAGRHPRCWYSVALLNSSLQPCLKMISSRVSYDNKRRLIAIALHIQYNEKSKSRWIHNTCSILKTSKPESNQNPRDLLTGCPISQSVSDQRRLLLQLTDLRPTSSLTGLKDKKLKLLISKF